MRTTGEPIDGSNGEEEESYQGLTSREESDLERLMQQCDFTISDAEAFTEKLSREVAAVDSSNIQAIMASEQKVANLMAVLQSAVDETLRLEQRIEHYQNLLKNVRDTVFQVEKKEALVQIQTENSKKLEKELVTLISQIDFPREYEYTLKNGDIKSKEGVEEIMNAAIALNGAINCNISTVLSNLHGVVDQRRKLESIREAFGERIASQMIRIIRAYVDKYGDNNLSLINGADLILPNHSILYSNLETYEPIMKWAKTCCRPAYDDILDQYLNAMKNQYKREIEQFFECIREKLCAGKGSTIGSSEGGSDRRTTGRSRSSSLPGGVASELTDTVSSKSSEISLSEWEEFDSWIDRMLSAIDPICLCEQQFCNSFFDLGAAGPSFNPKPVKGGRRRGSVPSSQSPSISMSPSPSNMSQGSSGDAVDPQKTETLRIMMNKMFSDLDYELERFTSFYNQLDGVYSMYLMVRLTQHVLSAQDTGSFLVKIYGKILILVKRNFDSFLESQKRAIEEARVPKRPKCGVFSFVKKFECLGRQAELIFRTAGARRTDIDRWYTVLVRSMFDAIDRLSTEHHKTPAEMVRIENYHALHDILRGLKIACLEQEKIEAKNRYNDAVKEYVARYFGRPLEKLNTFFEGVQAKVAQGVRAEEVGYQMAYSKTELRKVIKDCSLKEVKRGLEEMYRKVEKHAFEPESTLIQVIWRSMQEEFISQYKAISEMIDKCYPDANLTLAFTVEDVLNVFSDIARSH